jgi:hypothetical protein
VYSVLKTPWFEPSSLNTEVSEGLVVILPQ